MWGRGRLCGWMGGYVGGGGRVGVCVGGGGVEGGMYVTCDVCRLLLLFLFFLDYLCFSVKVLSVILVLLLQFSMLQVFI